MIEKMRNPKKSRNIVNYTVYALIFGMIIATFVFMIPGLGDGGGAVNSAAEVGSESISLRTYTDQLRRTRDQYSKIFNGEIPPAFEQNLRSQVLQSLVKREVLNQYAEKNNLIVSPVEVADFIKKDIPAFQEDGEFSYTNYNLYLTNSRSTAKKFEDMISKDIASRRIYDLFAGSLSKSDAEAKLDENASNVELSYSYIRLEDSKLQSAVRISDSIVTEFVGNAANAKMLDAQYSSMQSQFEVPAKAELGYILIKDQKAAEEVSKTLTAESFAEVAKVKSEDPLSKNKGGDLGEITKGTFSPEIEAKAFAMKKGEVSEPFKTGLGYAIVHVRNLKPKSIKLLDEVKTEVAKAHLQKEGVSALKLKMIAAAKAGSGFDSILSGAKMNWSGEQKYSLGSSELPGLGSSEEVVDKLLSLGKNKVYGNIVAVEDGEFFIRLNSLNSKKTTTDSKTSQNKTTGRSNQLIDLVYENEKSAMNIELNRQLLDQ